jgi:hypothetical protein
MTPGDVVWSRQGCARFPWRQQSCPDIDTDGLSRPSPVQPPVGLGVTSAGARRLPCKCDFHGSWCSRGACEFCRIFHLRQFGVCFPTVMQSTQIGRATMVVSFKGAHFPQEIMLMGVRW